MTTRYWETETVQYNVCRELKKNRLIKLDGSDSKATARNKKEIKKKRLPSGKPIQPATYIYVPRNKGIFMKRTKTPKCHERRNHTKNRTCTFSKWWLCACYWSFILRERKKARARTHNKSNNKTKSKETERQRKDDTRAGKKSTRAHIVRAVPSTHNIDERPKLSKMWSFKANTFALPDFI